MRTAVVIFILMAAVFGTLYYFGTKKPSKNKTDVVWVKYFKDVGENAKDTEAFVLRVTKDTTIRINDTVAKTYRTQHLVGPEYYVPYDTLLRCDTCKDTTLRRREVKFFIHVPKQWIIFDYDKHGAIMNNDTMVLR